MLTVADHDPVVFATIRRDHPKLWPNHRRLVRLAHDEDAETLRRLDAELEVLTAHRRACVERLRASRRRLYPGVRNRHHRRTRLAEDPPMPPAPADATPVSGLELRRLAVSILHRHGTISLRELHGLIHRYGYQLASERPVQRLADALAYEVRHGRAERVERGVYGPPNRAAAPDVADAEPLPWSTDSDASEPPPVDPDLRDDPERWSAGEWPSAAHPGGDWCPGPPDPELRSRLEDLDALVAATRRRLGELVVAHDADRRRRAQPPPRPFPEDLYEHGSPFVDDEYPDEFPSQPDAPPSEGDLNDETPAPPVGPSRPVGDDSSANRSPVGGNEGGDEGGGTGGGGGGANQAASPGRGSAAERTELGDDLG